MPLNIRAVYSPDLPGDHATVVGKPDQSDSGQFFIASSGKAYGPLPNSLLAEAAPTPAVFSLLSVPEQAAPGAAPGAALQVVDPATGQLTHITPFSLIDSELRVPDGIYTLVDGTVRKVWPYRTEPPDTGNPPEAVDFVGPCLYVTEPVPIPQVWVMDLGDPGKPLYAWGHDVLSKPHGICVASNGAMFVSDTGNGRVIKFHENQVVVLPFQTLGHPYGVAVDEREGKGHVYVSDHDTSRILRLAPGGTEEVFVSGDVNAAPIGCRIDPLNPTTLFAAFDQGTYTAPKGGTNPGGLAAYSLDADPLPAVATNFNPSANARCIAGQIMTYNPSFVRAGLVNYGTSWGVGVGTFDGLGNPLSHKTMFDMDGDDATAKGAYIDIVKIENRTYKASGVYPELMDRATQIFAVNAAMSQIRKVVLDTMPDTVTSLEVLPFPKIQPPPDAEDGAVYRGLAVGPPPSSSVAMPVGS